MVDFVAAKTRKVRSSSSISSRKTIYGKMKSRKHGCLIYLEEKVVGRIPI